MSNRHDETISPTTTGDFAVMPTPASLWTSLIGRHVSHFHIIRNLGSGGMGVVYEAQDTRLPRSVAIKFLNPALSRDVDAIRRFKREARLASSLNHANICTILDVDEGEGQPFIAMELLHGRTLKARIGAGTIPTSEILDITCQLADALGTAHDQGIMHRDITPGNVFVTDGGVVKLLDFGLAKHFQPFHEGDVGDDVTASGTRVGTTHYMAPEQIAAIEAVDYRCDLFSLGAVLYHLSTGARPFEAASKQEVAAQIREHPHVPVRQLAPDRPVQLERMIDKLLSKRPDDRYQSAWALRADSEMVQRQIAGSPSTVTRDKESRKPSIAILPFEIIGSGERRLGEFRDGLAEDISFQLTSHRDIRVAPRTSTRPLAGESIRAIGRQLGVDMVLEGSVQQSDQRVRVIASVVDAAAERALVPPIKVERQFDDLLTVQDDVAREVVAALSSAIPRVSGKRYTQDPEAHHAFKRGQHHWKSCFTGGWRAAIDQFQHAADRDPQFALAHTALASAYNFLGFYCLMKPKLAFDVARKAAEKALTIDDTLAAAHTELAVMKFGGDWDWDGSEHEFRRALSLDPSNGLAHVYYSWLLMLLGREDAAFAEAQAGRQLAPSSRLVSGAHAQTLYVAGRYEEAISLCGECLRFDPHYVFAMQVRGLCSMVLARYEQAIADLEQTVRLSERAPFYLGLLGLCYGGAGRREPAFDLIAELNHDARQMYVPPQCYVFIYAGLGDRSKALEFQEKAYEDGASPFNYLTPPVRQLYALDPHHKTRLEQMRLTV